MHKISEQSAQRAQQHALIADKHGTTLEAFGKALQGRDQTLEESGQFIEEYGQTVQRYAEESLLYAMALQEHGADSTKVYGLAVNAHMNATQAHVQAVKIYSELVYLQLQKKARKPGT